MITTKNHVTKKMVDFSNEKEFHWWGGARDITP